MKRNTTMHITNLMLMIMIFLFINLSLKAQEVQDTLILRTHKSLPILNGFRFIPSDVVPDPFISTFIKLNVGTGTAFDLNSYVKNLQGNVIDTLSGDLTYILGEAEFQLAVNDW